MKALVLTHHPDEGPGLFKEILIQRGWEVQEVWLWKVRGLPEPAPFHLLVIMGGPLSVNEEDSYPFLLAEKDFVRRWIEEGNPTLGVCLGAQLIADVLGSRVYKGHCEEIGWYEAVLTEEGKRDRCLCSFPQNFSVFQWHAETYDLPKGSVNLATSQNYPHQAFRFGDRAYGFQFHLEVTEEMIEIWLNDSDLKDLEKSHILSEASFSLPPIHRLCHRFMLSFLEAIR